MLVARRQGSEIRVGRCDPVGCDEAVWDAAVQRGVLGGGREGLRRVASGALDLRCDLVDGVVVVNATPMAPTVSPLGMVITEASYRAPSTYSPSSVANPCWRTVRVRGPTREDR